MRLILSTIFILTVSALFAKPQVFFNYKVFYKPDQTPFISTSLQFMGGTFKYTGDDSGDLNASVEITQVFSKNGSIVIADKYILNSPVMKDSIVDDFYDVQRYGLEPGTYSYELIIRDIVSGESVTGEQSIEVLPLNTEKVGISDIEFIEDARASEEQSNFTKSGFFILPYLTNYYPPEMNKLAFYAEIYNSDRALGEDEQFLITSTVETFSTGELVSDIFKFQRVKTAPVCPIISSVPIDNLPSGDYNLMINVIDKNNDTLISSEVFFQRRNDVSFAQNISLDEVEIDPSFENDVEWDSIPYYLGSLMPISERYESDNIRSLLKKEDTLQMQKYLYSYWRGTNPTNPFKGWTDYKAQVRYTQKLFGTQIKSGYETDRGRTHLKYGSPNTITDRPSEPSAYPYQIWHYYRIGQRSNVRFVFYNPDLVTNDYPMLHSDMRGELQNFRWQNDLHKRDSPTNNVDDPGGSDQYGGASQRIFNTGL